jgi:EAL domain-containing protein (putative c-di-GMP-specific phosphodiesterase class I)/GGDEF domain-containing protein
VLNRSAIFDAVGHLIDSGSDGFAVLSVRMRGLRELGLRFGIERGEQAIAQAEAMISAARSDAQVVCAGDETFAVILPGLRTPNHVLLAVAQIIGAFETPATGGAIPWHHRPSIGVALYPAHGRDADGLWRRAELALDEAHRRGESYVFFSAEGSSGDIAYHDLRESIEANRLRTYFQPIWDLRENRRVGVESLTRWRSPASGDVSPTDFIAFAEQSDLIGALTRWSVNSTLRHAAMLRDVADLTCAINFSPLALITPGMTEQLTDAMAIWGVSPKSVVVEVTETALVDDYRATVAALERIRDLGLRIAIDDFGTGYASIAYLSRFPATDLKIDKSLVACVRTDARIATLVRSIINLSHDLSLQVTAEGIEDDETLGLMTQMGCDLGQGYWLGRPEPAADFIAKVNENAPSA